jgi:membrane fusion protein (multidrug efflux system)
MKKRIFLSLLGVVAVVAILGGIKALQIGRMIEAGESFVPPPETVTTAEVRTESWESLLTAVGSLEAVQGVTVSAELPGKVVKLGFESGAMAARGDILLEQDTSSERARLPGAEAAVALAKNNFRRAGELLREKFISQAEYDRAESEYRVAVAAADEVRATIAKKTIRAPFSGRLGIRLVNLGEILQEGDDIVSLQSLHPIFANFLLPQQQLGRIGIGLPVRVTTDALAGETIEGRITAINPEVDAATRNVRIQATAGNPGERLRPGMFANVAVVLPERNEVLTIPATAVLYAPYSDSVFVVEEKKDEETGETSLVLRQQLVRLGEKKGDFVAVASGLREEERVVSTGVFKLRNGQAVVVDNTLEPEFKLQPQPENE